MVHVTGKEDDGQFLKNSFKNQQVNVKTCFALTLSYVYMLSCTLEERNTSPFGLSERPADLAPEFQEGRMV